MSRTKVLPLGSDNIIIVNTCSTFNRRFILFLMLAVFLDSSFQCLVNRLSSCVYRDKILFNATFKGQTVLTGVPGARALFPSKNMLKFLRLTSIGHRVVDVLFELLRCLL